MPHLRLCRRCGKMVSPFELLEGLCVGCNESMEPSEAEQIRREVYESARWRGPRGTRARVLRRDGYKCMICGAGGFGVTLIADHKIAIAKLIRLGRDPFDENECQTLCAECSGKKDGPRGAAVRHGR